MAADENFASSFIHAPHSRERLKITRAMFMFILTYHQVIPSFLDFVFPFGKQEYNDDFQFSGFRSDDRLAINDRGLDLPDIGRSGRDIRMCYNLKSVEQSEGQKQWPWSIRQTALYHSFDTETGHAFWIFIKGDQLMRRRIEAATNHGKPRSNPMLSSLAATFSSALDTHLIIFDWCREHWRWYINFIERELQRATRQALLVELECDVDRVRHTPSQRRASETMSTGPACSSPVSLWEKSSWRIVGQIGHQTSKFSGPLPQRPPPQLAALSSSSQESLDTDDEFSFSDLQQVQSLEEKANEVGLILDSNINTLSEIRQHYRDIIASEEFPANVKLACARNIFKFEKTIGSIMNDLQMQQSRAEMLLRLLTDRKSLVSCTGCDVLDIAYLVN